MEMKYKCPKCSFQTNSKGDYEEHRADWSDTERYDKWKEKNKD